MAILRNQLLYQSGWFACALGAATGRPWLGVAAVALLLTLHLRGTARPEREVPLLLVAALLGLVVDTTLVQLGAIRFTAGVVVDGVTTPWMLSLWVLFAATWNVSLYWLHRRPLWAALFGALGGPLAYRAGELLGAIELGEAPAALIAIAAVWAVALALFTVVAARIDTASPAAVITGREVAGHV
jgi:hypothetical protein